MEKTEIPEDCPAGRYSNATGILLLDTHFITLRAESFAGRKFREIKKSRNFADLSFANSSFRRYFIDKTFANSPKIFNFGNKNLEKMNKM